MDLKRLLYKICYFCESVFMNIKILLATIISFFLIQPVRAQDTVKVAGKTAHKKTVHGSKNNAGDSLKEASVKKQAYLKDTTKIHKSSVVKVPKYKRDGYVAVMGGVGFPAGAYASGNAAAGSVFSISAGFPGVISHSGFAFKFDYGMNSLNQQQYISSLNNQIGISNINYAFTGTPEKFSDKTLLTGLYITYPGNHLTIDVRILGGVMMATYPAYAINIVEPGGGVIGTINQFDTKGTAFAIDFGIEARYHVKPKLSIIFSMDYLHANPSFTDVVTGIVSAPNGIILQENGEETSSQSYNLFNLSLGVGYTISAQKPSIPR